MKERLYYILMNILEKLETSINVERITDNEIDTLFGSASGTGTDAQDYVVEHGTKDGWYYRKWASGCAEALIKKTVAGEGTSSGVTSSNSLNSVFGVNNSNNTNTIVTVANANGNSVSAHITGTTFLPSNSTWYALYDRSVSNNVEVVVKAEYFV